MAIAAPPQMRVEEMDRLGDEEFMELAPEKPKAELIDGIMIMSSPATIRHERLQVFLLTVLNLYVGARRLGVVVGPNGPVRLASGQIFSPDIFFVTEQRLEIVGEKEVHGAPDFVIEILSASTVNYDRGRKREVYAQAGVRELWLIDPYGPTGTQFYQRQADALVEIKPVDGIVRSIAVPGFWIDTSWLWPRPGQAAVTEPEALKALGQS